MKKTLASIFIVFCGLMLLVACGQSKPLKDGIYSAELKDYDNHNYKEFIVVTVKEGDVTAIQYDAKSPEGALRNTDEKYKSDMEPVQGTFPKQYTADLVNQYLANRTIEKVDAVAGATNSSQNFSAMFKALKSNMQSGDTSLVVVENAAP